LSYTKFYYSLTFNTKTIFLEINNEDALRGTVNHDDRDPEVEMLDQPERTRVARFVRQLRRFSRADQAHLLRFNRFKYKM
jgi:hypothetical protein